MLNLFKSTSSFVFLTRFVFVITVCTQDISHQDQIGQKAEAKSSNSQLDPDENWQHHQVSKIQYFTLENDWTKWIKSKQSFNSILDDFGNPNLAKIVDLFIEICLNFNFHFVKVQKPWKLNYLVVIQFGMMITFYCLPMKKDD